MKSETQGLEKYACFSPSSSSRVLRDEASRSRNCCPLPCDHTSRLAWRNSCSSAIVHPLELKMYFPISTFTPDASDRGRAQQEPCFEFFSDQSLDFPGYGRKPRTVDDDLQIGITQQSLSHEV